VDTDHKIELDFCTITRLDKNVVMYDLTVNMPLTIEKAEAILHACNQLNNEKYYLINVMSVRLQPSADVFDFYAS
jgi:hypothetical protein